jgi:transposase
VPWEIFQDVAPQPPVRAQGGGRRRYDDRAVLAAIIFVATPGSTWRQLPPVSGASWQTVHRRFTDWSEARVWAKLHRVVLDRLDSQALIPLLRGIPPPADPLSLRAETPSAGQLPDHDILRVLGGRPSSGIRVGSAEMSVTWAATALESGRYSAVERDSDVGELADHFNELRSRGQGYIEVRLPVSEFPLLALGFQGDQAVIHRFDDAERSSLLVGDGTAAADAMVDVPVMDDLAAFSGDFVLTVDRAWALVHDFIQTGVPGELGDWCEL